MQVGGASDALASATRKEACESRKPSIPNDFWQWVSIGFGAQNELKELTESAITQFFPFLSSFHVNKIPRHFH